MTWAPGGMKVSPGGSEPEISRGAAEPRGGSVLGGPRSLLRPGAGVLMNSERARGLGEPLNRSSE